MAKPSLKPKKSAPASPSPSPSRPMPSSWRLRFEMAWSSWLKPVALILPFGLLLFAWWLDLLPGELFEGILLLSLVAFCLYSLFGAAMAKGKPLLRYGLLALTLGLGAASAYPLYLTLFPTVVFTGNFAKEGESKPLPASLPANDGWKAEVYGKMASSGGEYTVGYVFDFGENGRAGSLKGELKRSWAKVKAGYKSIGKKLVDNDHRVQVLEADLSTAKTVTLKQLKGALEGPLHLSLSEEPASVFYLLAVGLPLLLLAAAFEASEDPEKRRAKLTLTAAFMILFSYLFADLSTPELWFNSFLFAALAAALGGLLLGWLLPKLLRPMYLKLGGR